MTLWTNQTSLWLMPFLALGLGVRHGFDLDHLATIDSMARSMKQNPMLSRLTGVLFSLGHGLVVLAITILLGSGLVYMQPPAWLEGVGQWVSIFFLLFFGMLTLWNLVPHTSVLPVGFKSFFMRLFNLNPKSPWVVVGIGALFALSFDTFSQAALFAMSFSLTSNMGFATLLGVSFMVGMMLADGLNGVVVSGLIQKADQRSSFAANLTGLMIGIFSLALGVNGLVGQL